MSGSPFCLGSLMQAETRQKCGRDAPVGCLRFSVTATDARKDVFQRTLRVEWEVKHEAAAWEIEDANGWRRGVVASMRAKSGVERDSFATNVAVNSRMCDVRLRRGSDVWSRRWLAMYRAASRWRRLVLAAGAVGACMCGNHDLDLLTAFVTTATRRSDQRLPFQGSVLLQKLASSTGTFLLVGHGTLEFRLRGAHLDTICLRRP